MTPEPGRAALRVDWTIPVPVLLGILAQAAAIVWWGAGINARVSALEAQRAELDGVPATIARLDERSKILGDGMVRVEQALREPRR